MAADIVVALDAGGSYVKATAFDLATGRFATQSGSVPLLSPQPGWHERDAEQLWQAAAACITGALQQLGVTGRDVLAAGLTGHGNGAYFVDAEGRPTRNAILATDTRAGELVHNWVLDGTQDALRPPAGLPIVAGLVDNPAAQHGSGVFDSSAICVGAGTWSINQFLVPVAEMT